MHKLQSSGHDKVPAELDDATRAALSACTSQLQKKHSGGASTAFK